MAIRGYVQPKTILGSIQYLNPGYETISADKQLIPIDSAIQALNPGANTLKVILPEVVYCDGMIFDIINTSDQSTGLLEIWEFTNTVKICDISPNEKRQLICLSDEWRVYDIRITNTTSNQTTSNYSFDSSMTTTEINNIIASIPKYIPPILTVNLNFGDNVFINMNLVIEEFYGGGTLNIQCDVTSCHTSFISSSGNVIRINNNHDLTINLTDLIITADGTSIPVNNHGIYYYENKNVVTKILRNKISSSHNNLPTDFPIYYISNYRCKLDLDSSRITYSGTGAGNHGIHCSYNQTYPLNENIISLRDIDFGNLDICVYSLGDYSISMLLCNEAMTETATPVAMPNNKGYEMMYGGKLAIDSASDTNLSNGTVAADSSKITIPAL